MAYSLVIRSGAESAIRDLPKAIRDRVVRAIYALADVPRPSGVRKLVGGSLWRVRVGDYRIVYEVDDTARAVTVTRVRHRREAYR